MQEPYAAQRTRQVCWVPVDRIIPRMTRAFSGEDSSSLNDLAESIRRDGLIQPITVRQAAGGRYEIVSGNRRFLACRMLGMTHIDAIVLASSPKETSAQQLLNRLLAGKEHYLEQADMLRELHVTYGLTVELLARQLGIGETAVRQRMRLCELDEETRTLLRETALPEKCGIALLRVQDEQARRRILEQALRDKLSPGDVELLATSARTHLPVMPAAGRTIALVRDSRLYLNALRSIAAQMQEAGIQAEVSEETGISTTTFTITVPTRHRRSAKYHQVSQSSQQAQCSS